jgi:two-component system cell cycle response regulator
VALLDREMSEAPEDTAGLVQLYDSIAALLADRGEWRRAYEHARHALDMISAEKAVAGAPPRIPQQFREEVARLRREHAEAREQAIRDALTASYNRRYLDQRLVEVVEQQGGRLDGLAVALVDLDWFKQVNDTYGHPIGDLVLQRVVELLQDGLPDSAFCARYGGEEFVLVIPGVDGPAAVAVAEAARARVEQNPWSTIALGLRVTVSIGLAYEPPPGRRPEANQRATRRITPQAQLRHADVLLYTAKQAGRNAVAYDLDGQTRLAGEAANRRGINVPRAIAHRAQW